MNKKFLKLLVGFIILLTMITVTCFATSDDATATSTNSENETSTEENVETSSDENTTENTENSDEETTEDEMQTHEGDLYLDEDTVNIDENQYISGNAYIKAKEVTISAPIDGNLFVQCDKLTIDQAYIRNSIFASAKEIYYNGYCNDLYVICDKMEMTYDSYIVRDMNAIVNSDLVFKTAVGGNANITVKGNIDFGADNDIGLVVGNLKIDTNSEVSVPEGVVEGEFTQDANATKDIQALEYIQTGDFFFDRYSNTAFYITISVITVIVIVLIIVFVILPMLNKSNTKTNLTPRSDKEDIDNTFNKVEKTESGLNDDKADDDNDNDDNNDDNNIDPISTSDNDE